jgi:hypothetical protein
VTSFTRFQAPPFTPRSRLQQDVLRHTAQRPGTIRRFWRAPIRYVGGANGQELSWTSNELERSNHTQRSFVSNPLEHLISTVNTVYGGNQLSRPMQRPVLVKSTAAAAPRMITNGNVQGRPVLRARIPSYGSRVPALNA